MNISANPWSFTSADVKTATISNLVQQAANPQLVNMTNSQNHNLVVGGFSTLIKTNPSTFSGLYSVIAVPTAMTATLQRIPGTFLPAGLTYNSGGTSVIPAFIGPVRGEDMSWQNAQNPGDELVLYSAYGVPVWDTIAPTTGNYSRGKPYWIIGVAPVAIASGTLFITVN